MGTYGENRKLPLRFCAGRSGKSLELSELPEHTTEALDSSRKLRPVRLASRHIQETDTSPLERCQQAGPTEPGPPTLEWAGPGTTEGETTCFASKTVSLHTYYTEIMIYAHTQTHTCLSAKWTCYSVCSHPQEVIGAEDKLELTESLHVTSKNSRPTPSRGTAPFA